MDQTLITTCNKLIDVDSNYKYVYTTLIRELVAHGAWRWAGAGLGASTRAGLALRGPPFWA